MDFLNKLGKKASETYQITKEKASNLSEELKLKGKISEKNDKIEELYSEIGKVVYSEMKAGTDVAKEDVVSKCEEISRLNEEIEKLRNDILALKNIKKCVNCGAELEKNADFCSKCGKEQPSVEKVEVKEEPTDVKEAEVVEVKDIDNENNDEGEENKESTDEKKDIEE